MAFFSKLKKAKGAAEEHKKAAAAAAVQEQPKPKVPYKHVPKHAAADALSATPTTIHAEELRERIAAARRSRSMSSSSGTTRSGTALYSSINSPNSRSRPSSVNSLPTHSRNGSLGKRTNSDLSISTMMQSHQEMPSRGRQPVRRDYFTHTSGVPAMPAMPQLPAKHRSRTYTTVSSRSSVKRRSPLSAMSINEDDEADEPSSSSSQPSDGSVASSQSSATELSRPNSSQDQTKDYIKEQNYSRPLSKIATAPATASSSTTTTVTPHSQPKLLQSTIEVSPPTQIRAKKSRWSLFSRKSMAIAAH